MSIRLPYQVIRITSALAKGLFFNQTTEELENQIAYVTFLNAV